jgi:hypothetical protein
MDGFLGPPFGFGFTELRFLVTVKAGEQGLHHVLDVLCILRPQFFSVSNDTTDLIQNLAR